MKIYTLILVALLSVTPAFAKTTTETAVETEAAASEAVSVEADSGLQILEEAPAPKPDRVIYHDDPVYVPLGGADNHPMNDMFELAKDSDPRAQYILGDLYSKGKGGIGKNVKLAKMLFEHSAKLGTAESFIRLAAIAKNEGDPIAAYKWYDLADKRLTDGGALKWVRIQRDALNLSRQDRLKAENAARTWDRMKLEPLHLNTPMNPLKTVKVKAEAKTETDAGVKAETTDETKVKTEEEKTDEQN